MILFLIVAVLFIGIVSTLSKIFVYGWIINKKSTKLFMEMDFSELRLNIFNNDMIEIELDDSYIYKTEGFIFRYNINKHGLVPFWNPLSKKIQKRFKELNNEYKNNRRRIS